MQMIIIWVRFLFVSTRFRVTMNDD